MRLRILERIEAESEALHARFARDGFLSLPDFLDPVELATLRAHKQRFLLDVLPGVPRSEVYYEELGDAQSLKQIQQLGQHDSFFRELASEGAIPRLAQALLGEDAVPQNVQYFDKPAGHGRATPAHQDGAYFPIRPNHAVTLWLALEDVNEDQGCVRYVVSSRDRGLLGHEPSGTLGFSRRISDFDPEAEGERVRAVPCRAGHLVAHHSLTIHWCGPNTHQDRGREAIGFIYYGAGCTHDEAGAAAYQTELARRLTTSQRI